MLLRLEKEQLLETTWLAQSIKQPIFFSPAAHPRLIGYYNIILIIQLLRPSLTIADRTTKFKHLNFCDLLIYWYREIWEI